MIRHTWPSGRRDAGFSLVELLVTIVIAAIVFAAMVPLFVTASKTSSADRARNIAMDVAQGRIDSIQLLSWSQLTGDQTALANNLNSSSFEGGHFGSTYKPPGSNAVYAVTYQVTPVTSSGVTTYVRVQVQVTTPTLPGAPPYTTTLATMILNPAAVTSTTPDAPTITSFAPPSGPVGTSVTVIGTAFGGATIVSFNGTAATTYNVDSSGTHITATVPTGATSGAISVTTPGGTATSTASFTVTASPTKYTLTVTNNNNGKARWVWVQGSDNSFYDQSGASFPTAPSGVQLAKNGGTAQFLLLNGTYTILVSDSTAESAATATSTPDPVTIASGPKSATVN
jgi:prepilin-type N-terminal cleavage/methylation domain-containing protein